MIKEEIVKDVSGTIDLVKHYSDLDVKIKQEETGLIYDNAVDIIPCKFTYTETDIPIEKIEDEESEEN